jgi:pilus assembly protein FimV
VDEEGVGAAAKAVPVEWKTEGNAGVDPTLNEAGPEATARLVATEYEIERNAPWHEIVTKLDLARAYQEMDDKESARQILEEVLREGDKRQRGHAMAILNRL